MGFDPDATFAVSDAVREHMAVVAERGAELQGEWEGLVANWAGAFPDLARERELDLRGEPREGWREALPVFPAGEEVATRDAGHTVMQALKQFTPTMVGGSADLVESNKTEFTGTGVFSATHAGRNIAFGIREHAMGSIVNGISLEPAMLRPYGSTFLIFSDYMRAAVRLSALVGLKTAWVWTHDSIAVGEDGPTHQPVEHHMALRAIPNLWYVRPADANETSMAWRIALERPDGPVALALTRQKLPTFDRTEVASADGALRGAYTLWQRRRGRARGNRDRHGKRGAPRARGRAVARGEHSCRLDALLGALRGAGRRLSGLGPAARRRGPSLRGSGSDARLGSVCERHDRYRPFRRLRSIPADLCRVRHHGRGDRRRARGRAPMRIGAAFDHRGVVLRAAVLESIAAAGHTAVDLGTDTAAVRIDYPDKALELGMALRRGEIERGVLVCGSGVGASVAASKIPGIRAAICHDAYSAHQGVEHDDMNVLCLGSEIVGGELTRELVRIFLGARFIGGGRYADRLEKVAELERMSDG